MLNCHAVRVVLPTMAFGIGALAALSGAGVPSYSTFELQARSNLCLNESPTVYNLPCDTFFTNGTPSLNNHGQVTVRLSLVQAGESQGVFFGGGGDGEIVYLSPGGAFLSDSNINSHGFVVFPQTFSSLNGVYFYDDADGSAGFLTNQPLGSTTWGSPQVNDDGYVAYRANFAGSGQVYFSYDPKTNSGVIHAAESGVEPGSPYSFLFTPSFNNHRQIGAKVRLVGGSGNRDEIRIFETDGSSTLIAQTNLLDPKSPYSGFDNSVSLTDKGWVAFTATLAVGGRGVYLSNGAETIEIATTHDPEINTIEFFSPAANNAGLVAFRARDGENLYAIFVGDGAELVRVIGQFDPIPTDLGEGQIAQHDASPTFGGGVSINDHGDIAFNAALTPVDNTQIEWGSGIYVAYADIDKSIPGDLNGDGVVDVFDLLILLGEWGPCKDVADCPADLNGDGEVNVFDLLILLGHWG